MVVIDASVAYKWFSEEQPNFQAAFKIIEEHKLGRETIIAPELLLYELANAWATKTDLTLQQTTLNLKKLQETSIELITLGFTLIQKAVVFSKKYQVTVYDAIYAVLAKEKRCDLITADKKFVEKINLSFVKLLEEYK